MATYYWYCTPVTAEGTATDDSVLVTVWFGDGPPPNPEDYDLVVIDTDADGLISREEWRALTGGPPGQDEATPTALFAGTPSGSGILYTVEPIAAGETGLKEALSKTFEPVHPSLLGGEVPCFAAGTPIETPAGPQAVETIAPGDLVCTLDGRAEPVRRIWSDRVPARGRFAPIRFDPGALGAHGTLLLSPNHRVLVGGATVELLFGLPRVLVMAKSLVNGSTISPEPTAWADYHHLVLDRHEVLLAAGLPAESFLPESRLSELLEAPTLREDMLECEDPSADRAAQAAFPLLSHREGRILSVALGTGANPVLAAAEAVGRLPELL